MGDSLSSLQFIDHGTKSVGLVCLPLKCEDSVITQHFTEVTCKDYKINFFPKVLIIFVFFLKIILEINTTNLECT